MWSGHGAETQRQNRDVQQRQNSFASDDANIISDVLGYTVYPDGLASEENINLALEEMQAALATIPAKEKVAIAEAQRSNPQLLDDDHVLQFLWAENFNAPVSIVVARGARGPISFCFCKSPTKPITLTTTTTTGCRSKDGPVLE